MLFYLNIEDTPLVLAAVEPNGILTGSNVLTITEIMSNEAVYTSFKAMYQGCSVSVLGKKKRPVLMLDLNNPHMRGMGDALADFTPFVGVVDSYLESGELSIVQINQLIADVFNDINYNLGVEESIFTAETVVALFNSYRRLFSYVEGSTSFSVVLNEIDRMGLEDNIREVNEAAILTGRSRLYTDNRINNGTPMKLPTDRFFFRVPGPRAIFENSLDLTALKPDIWTVYTKDHIETVKSYPRAFHNPELKGSAVNIDAPFAKSEQEIYTALCQMMADSVRLPKTDFVYATSEPEDEEVEDAEDEAVSAESGEVEGKKAKVELPPGKMYSCRANEIIDMSEDDDFMMENARLDKEVEEYMLFLIKTIGSWNWAYSGCFPHAEGYSEVTVDVNGGVIFNDISKVSGSMVTSEEFITTYDAQDPLVANQYSRMGVADITSRQSTVERYILECYKEFGPKVLAEAIVRLSRWGSRRPSKLHLGGSKKYFNLNTGIIDTKSGDISSMEIREVEGKIYEPVAVITAESSYRDKGMTAGENRAREVTGFPVGFVMRTTYVNKEDNTDTDSRWTYMSMLDLVTNFLTGKDKETCAFIDMDAGGNFKLSRDLVKYSDVFQDGYDINNIPSDISFSTDGERVGYVSSQLSNILLLLKVDQKSFSHLQSYSNVRGNAVIRSSIGKFDEPRLDKIRDYLGKMGVPKVQYMPKYVDMYLHNLYDEFMLPCVEGYMEEVLQRNTLTACDNNLVTCTSMFGTVTSDISSYPLAFITEYFLNKLKDRILEVGYRGEGSYCTGEDFIKAYNIQIPNFVLGGASKMSSAVTTNTSSEKMSLLGDNEESGLTPLCLLKPVPEASIAQPLMLQFKDGSKKFIAPIYIGKDNNGVYGIVGQNSGQNLSDAPVTAVKSVLAGIVFDTLAFELDTTGQCASILSKKSLNRIYFEDIASLVQCRRNMEP